MKKTLTTLALGTLIISQATAKHMDSDLNLRLFNNQPIQVQIDDQHRGQMAPRAFVQFNDIRPGRHALTVWTKGYGRRGGLQIAYQGFIDVPTSSRVSALVTRNMGLRITDVIPLYGQGGNYGTNDANFHDNYDQYGGNHGVMPNGYGNCAPQPMCDAEFQDLKACLASRNFDSTRLLIAKDAICGKAVTTCQVEELMDLMCFESSKLELAKFAYAYTVDQNRYFKLYDAFAFDSSVRELSNFIAHC